MIKNLIFILLIPICLFGAGWDTGSGTALIDEKPVKGLNGEPNSLAYKVAEIERHFHSAGVWYGKAANVSGETHVASVLDSCTGAFRIDAGNNTWGAWVQILGSEDTPFRANRAYFDPHEIVITSTEGAYDYFIQFGRGASGAASLLAGTYTETVFASSKVGQKSGGVIDVQTGRAPAGSKLWARCKVVGQNTATIDFYLGIHEYEGN